MDLHKIALMMLFCSFVSCSPGRRIDNIMIQKSHMELIQDDSIIWFSTTDNKPDARKDVVYFSYFKNGIKYVQGHYNGKLLNGKYQLMGRDHNIILRGEFNNGLKHNEWVSWHGNGLIESVETWKYGKLNGKTMHYDETGNLVLEGRYFNDSYHGKWVYYHDSSVVNVEEYRKGKLIKKREKKLKSTRKSESAEEVEPLL
jgi:hypothetical protein